VIAIFENYNRWYNQIGIICLKNITIFFHEKKYEKVKN